MALVENRYKSPWGIERVFTYIGEYGAKGEKKQKREKATKEQIRKQNQKNKENRVRRKLQLNFLPGDWWLTLKYPRGTRKPMEEVKKDLERFFRYMRSRYGKVGVKMKWMRRIEIGSRGGIHVHVVMNRLNDPKGDLLISDAWTRARKATPLEDMLEDGLFPADGLAHLDHVRAMGNGKELAEYLVKPQPSVLEDGTELTKEELKQTSSYSCSHGLKEPEPERKKYVRRTMRKIMELGAEGMNTIPNRYRTEGYMVDKGSWQQGVNPITGLSYLSFFEIPVRRRSDNGEQIPRRKQRQRQDGDAGTD